METPAKRRKLEDGSSSSDGKGEGDAVEGDAVETSPSSQGSDNEFPNSKPPQSSASVVQVAASSPAPPARHSSPRPLSSLMAPAGTVFRPPVMAVASTPAKIAQPSRYTVDISDDDSDSDSNACVAKYQDRSSDIESPVTKSNIRPTVFQTSAGDAMQRFKSVTTSSVYDPSQPQPRSQWTKSSDVLANAYGGGRTLQQSRPAKPSSTPSEIKDDISLLDIPDHNARKRVERMRNVLPQASIQDCWQALIQKRNNFDDALDYMLAREADGSVVDLTNDDHQYSSTTHEKSGNLAGGRQKAKAPIQKIHEKWRNPVQSHSNRSLATSPPKAVPKARRRLVQRQKETPIHVTSSPPISASKSKTVEIDSDDSEPVQASSQDEPEEESTESEVLEFFNTCSSEDLVDTAAVSEDVASKILSQRPFRSIGQVRRISNVSNAKDGKKKSSKARPIGDRVVDKCLEMWSGYKAIDELVLQCEMVSKSIEADMAKWGISIYGSGSKDGALDIVNLDNLSMPKFKDSGIGTPTSRSGSDDGSTEDIGQRRPSDGHKGIMLSQPSTIAPGRKLKDYQIVGMNWLLLLFKHGLSCILADDMGLGKTCQVIAFLAQLAENGTQGPHLIIVPSSTIENWLREFQEFCPSLSVVPYYANQNERFELREEITANIASTDVIITTYTLAKNREDNKFLRKLKPVCCIYDEGHMLRNSKSQGYAAYMRIQAQFRLLLTGTPLQNNLIELVSLLGFILPSIFEQHSEDLQVIFNHRAKTAEKDETHAALLSQERVTRAKSMMSPFVLRRRKHQVLKDIPTKHRRTIYCEPTEAQRDLYQREKQRAADVFARRQAGTATTKDTANIMMNLRKAAIHPMLMRYKYTDEMIERMARACLVEDEFRESEYDLVVEDMQVMNDIELHQFCLQYDSVSSFALPDDAISSAGKVQEIRSILEAFKENDDRVLIFSQFVWMMNILEIVLEQLNIKFFRLDGTTKVEERQTLIDEFHDDTRITAFLLSTKAGGAGINLACANKVIIYDSSFNPQDDIQAENRAHRVGQTREVEVIRLITKGTIEEQINTLGETKLALDDRVAGEDAKAVETKGEKMVEEMLTRDLQEDTSAVPATSE